MPFYKHAQGHRSPFPNKGSRENLPKPPREVNKSQVSFSAWGLANFPAALLRFLPYLSIKSCYCYSILKTLKGGICFKNDGDIYLKCFLVCYLGRNKVAPLKATHGKAIICKLGPIV